MVHWNCACSICAKERAVIDAARAWAAAIDTDYDQVPDAAEAIYQAVRNLDGGHA